MPATIIEGKLIAEKIKQDLKKDLKSISESKSEMPKLLSIQVGADGGSAIYVKSQAKVAEELGIIYELKNFNPDISENDLINFIENANVDARINGIIIQMPLPAHIDAKSAIYSINPKKDAEGIQPVNLGKIILGDLSLAPCTPLACMAILEWTGVDLYGKEVVVVGHSDIVGKPIGLMLLTKFATTTTCHIGTSKRGLLEEHVKRAEVLVVAVGKASLIKGSWIKEGSIVIDVGINRVNGKITGDVEFDEAAKHAKFITPVPGGVGAITVTMLMKNVVNAYKIQKGISIP